MIPTIYHLKTKSESAQENTSINSELIIQKFVESCRKLDANIFEPFIHEDDIFQDKEKYLFLASLKKLFDKFRNSISGEIPIEATDDICTGCSFGKPIKIFTIYPSVKNPWLKRFGFVIDTEKGQLKDIYQCYQIF
jgi:hypothetical protein